MQVWCLAVSSMGDFVVTSGADRALRVWQRTEEPFFVEEEKEKRLESLFEADLEVRRTLSLLTSTTRGMRQQWPCRCMSHVLPALPFTVPGSHICLCQMVCSPLSVGCACTGQCSAAEARRGGCRGQCCACRQNHNGGSEWSGAHRRCPRTRGCRGRARSGVSVCAAEAQELLLDPAWQMRECSCKQLLHYS